MASGRGIGKENPMVLKRIMMAVSLAVAVIFGGVATALAHDYTLRITNLMDEELPAPIVVTSARMD